ncbi:MAG: ABC transporter substrate-binding protein [Saccharofermentanales bacterium]
MKQPLRIVALFCAFIFCFAMMAGCTGNQTDPDSSGGKNGTNGNRESIIRLTADSTPTLDPASHTGNASAIAYCNLYDTLVFPTAEGVEPDLAESWEANAEGTAFTFKLKKGVKFHDGTELKASDVVFTMKRMQEMGEGFAYLYQGIVKDVTADDDYTVTFKLATAYGPFVSTLCRLYILNEELVMANKKDGAYGANGDYGREWLLQNDAGSGPYKVKEMVQNDYFLAEKFDDWHKGWEGRGNTAKEFKIIYGTEAATVRTMMSTQKLEISDPWQSTESYNALDKLDGVSIANYSTRLMQNVIFNCKKPPMDDINVRKAMCHLLDYETLLKVAFTGSKQPAGPVSFFTAGHVDCTQYEYSIDKAKELIGQSKYADTIGDYTLEFLQISDNEFLGKVALQLQAAAKEVGVTIKIEKATWNIYQERVSNSESAPHITSCNSGPSFNEAGATLESQFHTKTAGSYENSSWSGSPELDARIADAMATLDKEERFKKYEVLQHYVTDEICPTAWLADLTERVAYQEYIKFPVAEATKEGKVTAYLMGYPFFMPDITFVD